VKTLHIASIVTVLAVVCLSIGLVSALSSSDVIIHATLSNPTPKAGDMVLVSVTFQSNVSMPTGWKPPNFTVQTYPVIPKR
jgi:hypothetical protein